jgi:hypothetical protein
VFLRSSASSFILELGLLGLALTLLINFLIYQDSRVVANRGEGWIATTAAGWTGATAIIAMAMFYTTIDSSVAISYPFWYLSGLIAAQRMRLRREG